MKNPEFSLDLLIHDLHRHPGIGEFLK